MAPETEPVGGLPGGWLATSGGAGKDSEGYRRQPPKVSNNTGCTADNHHALFGPPIFPFLFCIFLCFVCGLPNPTRAAGPARRVERAGRAPRGWEDRAAERAKPTTRAQFWTTFEQAAVEESVVPDSRRGVHF